MPMHNEVDELNETAGELVAMTPAQRRLEVARCFKETFEMTAQKVAFPKLGIDLERVLTGMDRAECRENADINQLGYGLVEQIQDYFMQQEEVDYLLEVLRDHETPAARQLVLMDRLYDRMDLVTDQVKQIVLQVWRMDKQSKVCLH